MLDASHGLLFAIPQEYGLIGGRLVVVKHPIVGVTTGDPHTSQSPSFFQWSLHWMDKLLMVTMFPQIHEWLPTAWP